MKQQSEHGKPITTVEQLLSTAAIVDFLSHRKNHSSAATVTIRGSRADWTISTQPALAQLLRERPHDVPRIAAFIDQRAYGKRILTDAVTVLRSMLESEGTAPALDHGFL